MNTPTILAGLFLSLVSCFLYPGAGHATPTQVLSAKQQSVICIAAFTASGNLEKLNPALGEGLDNGLTVSEIKELIVQLYAYAGFPRSLNALGTFRAVLDERQKQGITDAPGKEASPMPAGKSSLALGTENQTRLVGQPVTGPLYDFAPLVDQFLKGHLFGDIFQRDILDWQTRELATIAALASIDGLNPQLQGHFAIGMNTGLTAEQLKATVHVLDKKVGKSIGDNAAKVLGKTLGG